MNRSTVSQAKLSRKIPFGEEEEEEEDRSWGLLKSEFFFVVNRRFMFNIENASGLIETY